MEQGWEEVFDYIFPEDEASRPNLKLLAAAKSWKKNVADNPALYGERAAYIIQIGTELSRVETPRYISLRTYLVASGPFDFSSRRDLSRRFHIRLSDDAVGWYRGNS
ncbi:hypothetical protein NQ318_000174 [Aromia moschata]|uniref:Uncharacterized protein n=1 Tax=Aromia moschata TaxID=1265417 RepID=A0AAV8YIF9_9CUCU|nr:hypothetical protein NQ318_000174 [Aromia moschata]